jgi:hypothetical protein
LLGVGFINQVVKRFRLFDLVVGPTLAIKHVGKPCRTALLGNVYDGAISCLATLACPWIDRRRLASFERPFDSYALRAQGRQPT